MLPNFLNFEIEVKKHAFFFKSRNSFHEGIYLIFIIYENKILKVFTNLNSDIYMSFQFINRALIFLLTFHFWKFRFLIRQEKGFWVTTYVN